MHRAPLSYGGTHAGTLLSWAVCVQTHTALLSPTPIDTKDTETVTSKSENLPVSCYVSRGDRLSVFPFLSIISD